MRKIFNSIFLVCCLFLISYTSCFAIITNGVASKESFFALSEVEYEKLITHSTTVDVYTRADQMCPQCGNSYYQAGANGPTEVSAYNYGLNSYINAVQSTPSSKRWSTNLQNSYIGMELISESSEKSDSFKVSSYVVREGATEYWECGVCSMKGHIRYRKYGMDRTETVNYRYKEKRYAQYGWTGESITALKNCTSNGVTLMAPVTIDGGSYSGSPAINSSQCVINKGTLTDLDGTSSVFLVGDESESNSVTADGKTITTVKLSNPPVIIDWSDFPGIDIDIDLNAPTIEVIRNPASTITPTNQVELTVRASDPDGHDSPTPISINGAAFVASPAYYTVTDNQAVTVVARDANGNTRQYIVNVENIDKEPPQFLGFTQSNVQWTKNPVVVTVQATDDVKMHETPYRWEFRSNVTGKTTTGDWTASRTFRATENGTLRCQFRDALGKTSWSEEYYITNIDKIAPTATITYSVSESERVSGDTGVTVQVNIIDIPDAVTSDSSGIHNQPVMWDTVSQQWSASLEHTFHENGTYQIRVRDALGNVSNNIPVYITQVVSADKKPQVTYFGPSNPGNGWTTAPTTIKVEATASDISSLPDKPYSWDGGKTWTSISESQIYNNGEYTVQVRDNVGNVTEKSCIVSNIDPYAPSASVYLYKGAPADWDYVADGEPLVDDYVWKIRVEAEDVGSGVSHIETMWDGGMHTTLPIIQEIEEPGVYGVYVFDEAGNKTYAEKVVTAESLGDGAFGSGNHGAYTDIKVPSTGSAGTDLWPEGASLQDLIFTDTGVLNTAKTPPEYKDYPAGKRGIPVNLLFTAKRNNYVTGYATFNGVKYPVTFPDAGGAEIIKSNGRQQAAQVFIPIDTVTQDVKNGRIKVVFQEWSDANKTTVVREGSATLYTSVQKSAPNVSWTYNKATDQITVTGTSTVAGIDPDDILVDTGSGYQKYTGPVTVGSADPVKIKVTDKAGNVTEITVTADDLQKLLSGVAGGTMTPVDISSLPGGGAGLNSYHISNRAADIYIIGGTRGNTNTVPPSDIYDTAK